MEPAGKPPPTPESARRTTTILLACIFAATITAMAAVWILMDGDSPDDTTQPPPTTAAAPPSSAPATELAPMTDWTIHAPAYGDAGITWGDLRATLTPVDAGGPGTVWISEWDPSTGTGGLAYMESICTGMTADDLEPYGIDVAHLVCVPDLAGD